MVRPADRRRRWRKMAELRAVQPAFPLYGTHRRCEGGQPYSHALLRGSRRAGPSGAADGARASKVGDQIVIGQATFTIRGVIASEPGGGMGEFSLGPRVLIDYDDLPSTGLLGVRQPRAAGDAACRVPDESRSTALVQRPCARTSGTTSSTRGRSGRPRIRSAATSIAPRTI